MERSEKELLIKKHSPKSPILKDSLLAFIFGGLICSFGEFLLHFYINAFSIDEKNASTIVTLTLIFIASSLTAVGVFDKIARFAGAGTLVPVTGFANAVVSEAMDSASEGYILGVGAKIFTVAGPVILFGISSGVVYGIILFIIQLF